jgi:pyruvate dehydrogenase E1 component beta subunit
MTFGAAIDEAIGRAMAADDTIVLIGEDVPLLRSALFARFGPERVMAAPISEAAFFGAATGAAMAGLRPVVELYMIDFMAVALDAVLNHMAKVEAFSGGKWRCPVLVRAPCGGGYGDGGQHGQTLWGMVAGIPGLTVVVPSTPADAFGLTSTALSHDGPVVLFEPKLLSAEWLRFLGSGGRTTVSYDVPATGARGDVDLQSRVPFGSAVVRRHGDDVTLVSLGVGVHRAFEAVSDLEGQGIGCEVIDLRSLRPFDVETVIGSAGRTGHVLVVDDDYREFGLSGEIAALILEAGLSVKYGRVCLEGTLPYARHLEDQALPNAKRIGAAVMELLSRG